jgi:hypothetical protein
MLKVAAVKQFFVIGLRFRTDENVQKVLYQFLLKKKKLLPLCLLIENKSSRYFEAVTSTHIDTLYL